jgi:hypothetical protein
VTRQFAAFLGLVITLSGIAACATQDQPVAGDAAKREQPVPRGAAAPPQPVRSDAEVIADFNIRLNAYLEIRKKAGDTVPAQKKTNDPGVIRSAQEGLAERIRTERAGAKQGDIFTPEIAAKFRRLLRPEAGPETKASIRDDNPGTIPFKVNGDYPEKQTLSTVPPNVLQALPRLPDNIEYRFVGKHLILRDSRANLIIDYMLNAIS